MTEPQHLRLSLELQPGTDPMRGRLVDEEGEAHPFRGWLELAEAIGAAIRRETSTTSPLKEKS